ncbi:putative nad dependent epimerase dehydratase family protein [Lasiodiplodia theobromae]|uniref:Short chain dehydrogenase gsfE n=1 Tax=Lasiodiplodia theobromae TaxID=45133 RepID=A0A5N5D3Z8_9PEZI|nr:Nad dependent epimerase dehydratase [Lasiodiplodia theobromae]KAB2572423.1 Short chain dehydrogenase gsfE [Lasiodiplodia theobromae]KAF4536623.1 Nad dependent epimerase dehydratase [Lasiodiplodia theobromae]KAF9634430.1 putative nad dependent epimerase dehydratase family protein [Lasiodiplodia theobromae]
MANIQQIQSKGIYHGLPVFSDAADKKDLTAIVTGANGISGQHMLRVLAQSPQRWSKIYCLSRRPPTIPDGLPQVEFISVDFLKSPDFIAKLLKSHRVRADYVFFYSYIQVPPKDGQGLWSNAEEMAIVNTELLSNFLAALSLADIKPRRVLLQTGAKHYGVHLGPAKVPQEESDPRVTIEPNFYYPQEDYLVDWCEELTGVGWNVIRPSFILGAVPDAAMNLVFPIAAYAAVCKHLGQKLEFPGNLEAWERPLDLSSAMLNGYQAEWAVLDDGAANEAFNAADGSTFTWGQIWPRLAARYGVEWSGPELDETTYEIMTIPRDETPRGYGPQATIRRRFALTDWAKKLETQQAWKELAQKHDLLDKELRDVDRIFAFADAALANAVQVAFSMDKSRRFGWFGTVSSSDCIMEVIENFEKQRMVPPIRGSESL